MITVEGVETFVHRKGAGKTTLILVHGAAYNHRLWRKQTPILSTISQVLAPDLPGHGTSARFAAGQAISIQTYANHVHAILSAVKCESAIMVGHSMGGAVSMRFTLDHPEKVKALILIGTGAKLGVIPSILDGLSSNFAHTVGVGIVGWAYAATSDKRLVDEDVREMLKCDQKIALADFKACSEFDIRESVSNVQAPTLIIVGEEDKLTPVKWSEFLHTKIRNSELRTIASAGHMVMLEKAAETNDALVSFIEKLA